MKTGDVNNFDKELKRQILEAFRKVDEDFLKEASQKWVLFCFATLSLICIVLILKCNSKPVWKDGTTACCVLILNDVLYIANLGDSKVRFAVLCFNTFFVAGALMKVSGAKPYQTPVGCFM